MKPASTKRAANLHSRAFINRPWLFPSACVCIDIPFLDHLHYKGRQIEATSPRRHEPFPSMPGVSGVSTRGCLPSSQHTHQWFIWILFIIFLHPCRGSKSIGSQREDFFCPNAAGPKKSAFFVIRPPFFHHLLDAVSCTTKFIWYLINVITIPKELDFPRSHIYMPKMAMLSLFPPSHLSTPSLRLLIPQRPTSLQLRHLWHHKPYTTRRSNQFLTQFTPTFFSSPLSVGLILPRGFLCKSSDMTNCMFSTLYISKITFHKHISTILYDFFAPFVLSSANRVRFPAPLCLLYST